MSKPIVVSDAEFENRVLESTVPVIVDFWAPWCTPCKMIAPILENIAQEYDGKLIVAKVNTDENPKWAMRYGVQGIPTLLFISNGKVVGQQVGVAPANVLKSKTDALLQTVSA
jgi:thioredoxin 1